MNIRTVTLSAAMALTAGSLQAAEVSQDAIDACIDQLRAQVSGGGTVTYTEFSEANSLVTLQDSRGSEWRCLVSNDGRSASIERSGGAPSGGATMAASPATGGPAFWQVQVNGTLNIRSAPSTSGQVVARLPNGMIVENRGCRDNEGRTWCEVADGDASGWAAIEFLIPSADGENTATAEDGGGAMAGSGGPSSDTEVVRFGAGRTGTDLSGQLTPGSSKTYVLGAANGQTLYVEFWTTDPAIEYQIFLPNGRTLLDVMPNTQRYEGSLFVSGDHRIEVINRGNATSSYNMSVTIN